MSTVRRSSLRSFAGWLGAALALALASCSSGTSSSPSDVDPDLGTNDPDVVVALGDSITYGYGDRGGSSCSGTGTAGFPSRLQSLTGKTVINAGICGEASSGGAARVESVLAKYRPAVLLIDYSPNDITTGVNSLVRNLRTMITAARNNKTIPILGTLVPGVGSHEGWEPFIEAANEKILALCDEQAIECADHHTAFITDASYINSPYALLSSDGQHPNSRGYELMAKTWRWPLLRVY